MGLKSKNLIVVSLLLQFLLVSLSFGAQFVADSNNAAQINIQSGFQVDNTMGVKEDEALFSKSSGINTLSVDSLPSVSIVHSTRTYDFSNQFRGLPSSSQLNNIISKANILEITKIIQQVVANKLNCRSKISYLSDFLGRINSFIAIKDYRIQDLQKIISITTEQIIKLQVQIKQIDDQVATLKITQLKIQLNELMIKLQIAYDKFNNFNTDDTPYKNKINELKNQIKELQKTINITRSQSILDKNQIIKVDNYIRDLEDQIAKARIQKQTINKRILQAESIITTATTRISQNQAQTLKVQIKIKELADKKADLKAIYVALQKDISSLKVKITKSQRKQTQLSNKLGNFKVQLSKRQNTLLSNQNQFKKVTETISVLKSSLPNIKNQIQKIQLQCNGVKNPTTELKQDQILIKFDFSQFKQYFSSLFGATSFDYFFFNQNTITNNKNINCYVYNIFSQQWSISFGKSYQKQIIQASNQKNIVDYTFISDFQCSNTNSLTNLVGKIVSIERNKIKVNDDSGKSYELQLGACSRISGLRQSIPQVGSRIAWKGSLNNGNRYDVIEATCQ